MDIYNSLGGLIAKTKWYSNNYIKKVFQENNIDISYTQWKLIITINQKPGLTQTELSKSAQKDKASVTRMLDILEKEDYVTRKKDPEDRRLYNIFLTEKGEAVFKKTLPLVNRVESDMLQDLTEEEVEIMKRCLVQICDRTRKILH